MLSKIMVGEFNDPSDEASKEEFAERLELALRASNEGIWDWRVDQPSIYYSDRIYGFFGRDRDDLPNIFTEPEKLLPADEVQLLKLELEEKLAPQSATAGGDGAASDIFAVDCQILSDEPTPRWLRIRGTIVRDDTGRAVRMAGSMIDISRRKLAESKAEDQRHRLHTLVDNVPLSIFFKDLDSRFTLVNKSMVSWMGKQSESELLGKSDHDLFATEHADEALQDERQVLETGEPILDKLEEETWTEKESTYVQTSKFPLRNRRGELIGTFGIAADVTELVRTQQQLAQVAMQLKERNEVVEEELGLAREIQQAFADPGDKVKNVSGLRGDMAVGTFYLPISGMAGDFYEVMPIREGVCGVLICDVMGHGVRSALVVAMLRGLMERERDYMEDPGPYLSGLNEGLHGILSGAGVKMFATAFYAVIDLNEGAIRYACAGHPAAIMRSGSEASPLPADDIRGRALGLKDRTEYRVAKQTIANIDELLFFTDGCYEVENEKGEPLGEEGLARLVAASGTADVHGFLNGIVEGVMKYSGEGAFDDDVCLLGLAFE